MDVSDYQSLCTYVLVWPAYMHVWWCCCATATGGGGSGGGDGGGGGGGGGQLLAPTTIEQDRGFTKMSEKFTLCKTHLSRILERSEALLKHR